MFPIGDDNSARRLQPAVTYALVAANVLVFLGELLGGDGFIVAWSFVPVRFLADPAGDSLTLFSSLFLHGSWLHPGGNMLYLWPSGDNAEDRFGHLRFLAFYLACGIAATLTQLAFSSGSTIPHRGASGAIAGVLGAYVLLFPNRRVTVFAGYGIMQMPALIVIGLWFVLQLFSGIGSIGAAADTGGVAFMAHVGGFVAGFVLAWFLRGNRVA
jgi:membrane associated rhomboid family serine protease